MKLFVVDDHPLFREGSCLALDPLGDDIEIHEATNFGEATEFVAANRGLDIIFLDLRLPGMHLGPTLRARRSREKKSIRHLVTSNNAYQY